MLQVMFSVYDEAAGAYIAPFFLPTIEMGKRAFAEAAASESHQFGRYAKDFTLYQIGSFDDSTGEVRCFPSKVSLGTALEARVAMRKQKDMFDEVGDDPSVQQGANGSDPAIVVRSQSRPENNV